MSAHVRPDDAPMLLPGFEPDPVHEALAALSRAADAACSRAAMGARRADVVADLDALGALVCAAMTAVRKSPRRPVDKSGGP